MRCTTGRSSRSYGDANLFSIIQAANPGVDSSRLRIGQVLTIPERPASSASSTTPAPSAAGNANNDADVHVVSSGETLSSIADKRLGRAVLWEEIYKLNRDVIGDNPAALKVGMKLRLPK